MQFGQRNQDGSTGDPQFPQADPAGPWGAFSAGLAAGALVAGVSAVWEVNVWFGRYKRGLEMKRALLENEDIPFDDTGRVTCTQFHYDKIMSNKGSQPTR